MQALDLPYNPSLDPPAPDPSSMSPIHTPDHHSSENPENKKARVESSSKNESTEENNSVKNSSVSNNNGGSSSVVGRRERPSRACTQRAAARLQAAAEAEAAMAEKERKRKKAKKRDRLAARLLKEESEDEDDGFGVEEEEEEVNEEDGSPSLSGLQCSKMVTPLVGELEPSQLPRWNMRSMWELASILNFLNVFRPLLNIKVEFSAEEFETALISPNNTLGDVHMPLLKAIPPVTRMALGHGTWITVLCRKLKDWWHWVAEGDLPIVASHGTEIEAYSALDPAVRVVILKALCDIRVEQEDIRNYIDNSIKHGVHLSAFRKERIGGDSHGVSYWYEDDPIIGHRLYREIRKVDVKKGKGKNVPPIPHSSYQWETVATNLDEFLNVSEKLFTSKNRTEVSVGKKLKNDMLPEIEKVHKRKEKLLKKQHRQALMLDGIINMDGLAAGRSLRDRKPVTYTFDDYDQSINEAIKATKKRQPSLEPLERREPHPKLDVSTNGRWAGPSQQYPRPDSFSPLSPESFDNEEFYGDENTEEALDRSNRPRQRPQRYSVKDYVEAVSENEADFDSDDDIVGEVVYDEDYLRKRKERRKTSSSSEEGEDGEESKGDEEYNWKEENQEDDEDDEEEEDEDNDDSLSTSDDESGGPRHRPSRFKKTVSGRTRRGNSSKLRSVGELQSGLRRSKRATRNRIDYKQYEMSESENEISAKKPDKSSFAAFDEHEHEQEHSDESDNNDNNVEELSMGSQDYSEGKMGNKQEMDVDVDVDVDVDPRNEEEENHVEMDVDKKEMVDKEESNNSGNQEVDGVRKRRFLDLNELAPGSGFDDGLRDQDGDDF